MSDVNDNDMYETKQKPIVAMTKEEYDKIRDVEAKRLRDQWAESVSEHERTMEWYKEQQRLANELS